VTQNRGFSVSGDFSVSHSKINISEIINFLDLDKFSDSCRFVS